MHLIRLCALLTILVARVSLAATTHQITEFDAMCGVVPRHNCLEAFQRAFSVLRKEGGGTLSLPAAALPVDMPDVSVNMDPRSARPLRAESLLSVPPNVSIVGQVTTDGRPDTTIVWSASSIPIFTFAGASNSSMRNVHARFAGVTPDMFPYGDEDLLKALGYNATFPHQNQMSGGNYEMFTFLMIFDSDHCVFDNLVFDSATPDNDHSLGIGINLKGKGLILEGGQGGLSGLATGNRLSNLGFYDFIMGILLSGQNDVIVKNVMADRRASRKSIAPGHVIYSSIQNRFDAQGKATWMMNKEVHVDQVSEGPDVYSNIHALGTLAVKAIDGGTFSNINSQFPLGLINTLYAVRNITFTNLKWQSDYDPCEHGDEACGTDVITFAERDDDQVKSQNISFNGMTLTSSHRHVAAVIPGDHLRLEGVTIESPIELKPHTNACTLCIKGGDHALVRNYVVRPTAAPLDGVTKPSRPLACFPCHDLDAKVVTEWPLSARLPDTGNGAITSDVHEREPEKHNVVVDTVRSRSDRSSQ